MKKIIIKEIDKYTSQIHKDKVVMEYMIHLILVDGPRPMNIESYIEMGKDAKDIRVNEMILEYFEDDVTKEQIIEEVNFENYLK